VAHQIETDVGFRCLIVVHLVPRFLLRELGPGIDKRINYHAPDTMKRKIRYNFLTIRRAQYEEQGLDETQVDSVV